MELRNNDLFKGLDIEEIEDILKNISFTKIKYRKGEILAHEGEVCTSLGIILEGTIEMQRIYCNGKYIVIKKLSKGEVFGEALVFSERGFYPVTALAVNDCLIMYIKKEEVLSLCFQNKKILENFISLLSNKILMLNKKIKNISFKSIKEKVSNYILEESIIQNTDTISLNESKEDISAKLGMPRPSFSRELMRLKTLGIIDFNRRFIKIINKDELENILF
ncbi:MAG: Crp/Fnr family transcriptional regulator [Clostridium sp.]|nr:Crp/Fnr family transcriptional regulator [Clostridium sp.]MCI7443943.1 Crp/Fnr family transcriptional regulator [Clostridium sp.]